MGQNNQHYGVIGGGFLGMTLAAELAKKGFKVSLYEAEPEIGGLTASWELGDFTWDKFYHVLLLSDSYTRSVIRDIGLEDKIHWVETKTGFYSEGQLISMSNTMEFLKFPLLSLFDKLRLGFTIYYASRVRNWKKLEQVYVADWLLKLSGKNTFEKIWLPLLRSKLGNLYSETSASFIWATIQRMYAARRSGLKKEMFGYVEGGYATILKAYEEKLLKLGVSINLNSKLKSISSHKSKKLIASFSNNSKVQLDKAVLTIPSSFIPGVCLNVPEIEKNRHEKIQYMGIVCLSVVLYKPISEFYVTNITDSGIPFTGIIEMSALANQLQFNNSHLVYLPKYVASNDPLFDKSDGEISDEFLKALLGMYPNISLSDIKNTAVARARNVFALSTINYSENLPPVKSAIDNLYILNSAHIQNGTLNVNETLKLAIDSLDLIN